MRILWDNLLSDESSYTPYSEDLNYPVENIYDTRLTRVYRTYGLASTEYIIIGETGAPEYVSFVDHNISSSATVYVEGGSSSGFSTLTFSETITWSSYTMVSTIASTVSCDYFKLRITGLSTATQEYISLGYVFLGDYIEMPGMKPNQSIEDETTSRLSITDGGQVYADDGYNYRAGKINFPYLTQTQRDEIRTMFADVKNYKPVILIIWPDNTDEETPIYCVIDQKRVEFRRTDDINLRWETSLNFREVF